MNTSAPNRPEMSFCEFLAKRPCFVRSCMMPQLMVFIWPQVREPFAVRSMLTVLLVDLSTFHEDTSFGKAPPQAEIPLSRSWTPAGKDDLRSSFHLFLRSTSWYPVPKQFSS